MAALPKRVIWLQLPPRLFAFARLKVSSEPNAGIAGAVMIVSVSTAVLLVRFGSVVVTGAVTVAVLDTLPVAAADTVAVAVKVALPPFNRFTVPLKVVPLPPPATQLEPPVAEHVQLKLLNPADKVSVTAAPTTALGPPLETTMVYVTRPPAEMPDTLSVLVTDRLDVVTIVSVSVAVLFAKFGSSIPAEETFAVFVSDPDAVEATLPLVVVNVTVLPTGKLTVRLMLPLPVPAPPQVAPPVIEHVQLIVPASGDGVGKLSVTVAPATASGPALLTTMVYRI